MSQGIQGAQGMQNVSAQLVAAASGWGGACHLGHHEDSRFWMRSLVVHSHLLYCTIASKSLEALLVDPQLSPWIGDVGT